MNKTIAILVCTTILAAQLAAGDKREILTFDERLPDNVTRMKVEIEFGFGEILVERGNPAKAVTGYIQYNPETIRPRTKFYTEGSNAYFSLVTDTRHEGWRIDFDTDEFDSPESELYFTTAVPLDLNFSCGLGEATLDFGNLQLEDLNIDNGLGETQFDFSTANRVSLRRISVDNGLGEITAENLSNANTDRLSFDCGLGAANLDFSGDNLHEMFVDISVGLGSVNLAIPEGYALELDAEENFLSSIDTHGLYKSRSGMYYSERDESDKPVLHIRAEVGLGSIDIDWLD